MNLYVNQVIEWARIDDSESIPILERILWIDSEASQIVTIELTDRCVLPKLKQYDQIILAIENGSAYIMTYEPPTSCMLLEDKIPEEHRRYRDQIWELIKPIVVENDPNILVSRKRRGRMIAEISQHSGRSKSDIYKFLNRYWKSGGYKNSLLPHYYRCGGGGQSRTVNANRTGPKRGRPRKYSSSDSESDGINITADIERRFEKGIKDFYEQSKPYSFSDAFQHTLDKYFHIGWKDDNDVRSPILPPVDERPTEGQFRYWYENKYRDVRREKTKRYGEREYKLRYRAVTGNSTQMARGPGSVYQIDATIADVYLVSSLNRNNIIGRPVIYVCIDVFSRMITGLCVTLEGPSWVGGMLALDNVVSNKVAFCAEYGITIQEEDWPCHHLPQQLLADRGEFASPKANNFSTALNVKISITAPYRADWKGIIERQFGIANDKVIHFIPGAVPRPRQRGDKDHRLDATLTLYDFRKLLITYVLHYNKKHYLSWYSKDEFQIKDNVELYPLELWKWGLGNRSGQLRTVDSRDFVRLHLLPSDRATVTPRGIHLGEGLYYTCDLAVREDWFTKARAHRSWKVEVSYDPRAIDTIYLQIKGSKEFEVCRLVERNRVFRGRDLYEVVDYSFREKQNADAAESLKQQSQADLNAQQQAIIKDAMEKTDAARKVSSHQSKSKQVANIRGNRKKEQELEQSQQGWKLDSFSESESINVSEEKTEDTYIPPASLLDLIRKSHEELWVEEESNEK